MPAVKVATVLAVREGLGGGGRSVGCVVGEVGDGGRSRCKRLTGRP